MRQLMSQFLGGIGDSGLLSVQRALFSAGQAAATRPSNQTGGTIVPPLAPRCSTGNCAWKPYGSLGICGQLVNLTSRANRTITKPYRDLLPNYIGLAMYGFVNGTAEEVEERIKSDPQDIASFYQSLNYVMVLTTHRPAIPDEQPEALKRASAMEFIVGYSDSKVDMVSEAKRTDIDRFHFLAMQFFYCTKSFETSVASGAPETKELESKVDIVLEQTTANTLNAGWVHYKTSDEVSAVTSVDSSSCPPDLTNRSLVLASPPSLGNTSNQTYTLEACTAWMMSACLSLSIRGMSIFLGGISNNVVAKGLLANPIALALYGGATGDGSSSKPADNSSARWENMEVLVKSVADSLTNM